MSRLLVDWAILGKEPDSHKEYRIISSSDSGIFTDFAKVLREFTSGSSDGESLPRTSTSYFSIGPKEARVEMLGMSFQDWSGHKDAFGRRSARTRFVCAPWKDFAAAQISYRSLYRALRRFEPEGKGKQTLDIEAYPTEAFGLDTRPLVRLTAGLLLTERPVCIVGADKNLDQEARLNFMDSVAARLPYGFRSSLAVSTWTHSNSPHNMRLSFASDAPPGATRVLWTSDPKEPNRFLNGLALQYLSTLEDIPDGQLTAVLARLAAQGQLLSFRREEELCAAVTLLSRAIAAAHEDLPKAESTVLDIPTRQPQEPPHRPGLEPGRPLPMNGGSVAELLEEGLRGIGRRDISQVSRIAADFSRQTAAGSDREECRRIIRANLGVLQVAYAHKGWPDLLQRFFGGLLPAVYGRCLTASHLNEISEDFRTLFQPIAVVVLQQNTTSLFPDAKARLSSLLRDAADQGGRSPLKNFQQLQDEPTRTMFEAVLGELETEQRDPPEVRTELERFGYFANKVELQQHMDRLLSLAHGASLDVMAIEAILKHANKHSPILLNALLEKANPAMGSQALAALLVPAAEEAALNPQQIESLKVRVGRLDSRARRTQGRFRAVVSRDQAIAGSGWVVAIFLGILLATRTSAPTAAPARPGPAAPLSAADGKVAAPVLFPWPSYLKKQKSESLSRWATVMVPDKCVALKELSSSPESSLIYDGLSAACTAGTTAGGDTSANWRRAQDAFNEVNGINLNFDNNCADLTAKNLLGRLVQTYQKHPNVPIKIVADTHEVAVTCS
jgi:hypothetical protein